VLLLLGLAVISVPLALSLATVLRVVRRLGAVDASAIGAALEAEPLLDLGALAQVLEREAPGSVADRVLRVAVHPEPGASLVQRRLALAEEVADIERGIVGDVRVPRVAASLATSGGLLAAALVMREGLSIVVPEGIDPVPVYYAVIERGLTLAAIAVFGGLMCAALHRAAQQQRSARLRELDGLVLPLTARLFGGADCEV
jgi:hypothetical protein